MNLGLPFSFASQEAVLGSLMLDTSTWPSVDGLIRNEDFCNQEHQLIFAAIVDIARLGIDANPVDVAEELDSRGQLEQCGGITYLARLARETATASTIKNHAKRVTELARTRRLREAAARFADDGDDLEALRRALEAAA